MPVIFVSYSNDAQDHEVAVWLCDRLESSGITVWRDRRSLRSGWCVDLPREIADAIEASDVFILVLSSRSAVSPWCQSEFFRAYTLARTVLLVEFEEVKNLPKEMLLLSSSAVKSRVSFHSIAEDAWYSALSEGLLTCGIAVESGPNLEKTLGQSAELIWPPYVQLRHFEQHRLQERIGRLTAALEANPSAGFNFLNLAFLWLYLHDAQRALENAQIATSKLPHLPDALYAEALARCRLQPPAHRSLGDTETILRILAGARRRGRYGAHIDLLSALVIANVYLPRCWRPVPAPPEELLHRVTAASARFSAGEICRSLDVEPLGSAPVCEYLKPQVQTIRSHAEAAIASARGGL
jgi:hypothetical protein